MLQEIDYTNLGIYRHQVATDRIAKANNQSDIIVCLDVIIVPLSELL